MSTPYVTNRMTAVAMKLGPLRKPAFRGYAYFAKRLNRSFMTRTYFGAVLRCDPNDYIQRMLFSFGFWEPHISAYIEGILRPGDAFVDVGANIGYYSLLAAQRVGSQGSVVAIEAAPSTFALLEKNLQLNRSECTLAINIAASDRYGQVDLYANDCLATTTTRPNRGLAFSTTVPCAPLSNIIPTYLFERVRLIKIDIEGGEIPVMTNLLSSLQRFRPDLEVIAEVSMRELTVEWRDIVREMRARGFTTYSITNEYDDDAYLKYRTFTAPLQIAELPDKQFDILFRRDRR